MSAMFPNPRSAGHQTLSFKESCQLSTASSFCPPLKQSIVQIVHRPRLTLNCSFPPHHFCHSMARSHTTHQNSLSFPPLPLKTLHSWGNSPLVPLCPHKKSSSLSRPLFNYHHISDCPEGLINHQAVGCSIDDQAGVKTEAETQRFHLSKRFSSQRTMLVFNFNSDNIETPTPHN